VKVWILADVSRSVPGGMRRHMELHAEGLERLGDAATVLLAEDVHGFDALKSWRAPGARMLLALRDRYRNEKPDVVNVHTQCAPAWIAARRAGLIDAKVVVMSYAADEPAVGWREPRDLLRWARVAVPARSTFPHADGIWCVNQEDAEYYVGTYGVERRRIGRFPHAVADAFYPDEPRVSRNPRRLLYVGTWIHRKGIDVLSAAFERVVRAVPDVEIVLAGTLSGDAEVRGHLGAAVSARTRILPVAGDAELRELYRSSALLLIPSRREGLPITMLEGMACGCPPLAAANSGMLDAVAPGENGWLEVSFDPERWATRVVELLRQPERLERASRGAVQTAEAFRIVTVARAVRAWYEALGDVRTPISRHEAPHRP
jgi:glycosyltransferase involved in cell wall biosynthesis